MKIFTYVHMYVHIISTLKMLREKSEFSSFLSNISSKKEFPNDTKISPYSHTYIVCISMIFELIMSIVACW